MIRSAVNIKQLTLPVFLFLFLALITNCTQKSNKKVTDWGSEYRKQGLVLVDTTANNISVNLRYSGSNNFIGKDVYGNLEDAYLQAEALEKLYKAASLLKDDHPELKLLIWDAARPRRIQQILWDTVDIPLNERSKYVANPASGSIHNYGCAVDLTLIDSSGNPLDMGTDYDEFDEIAHIDQEDELVNSDLLTREQVRNRRTLRAVMTKAGFNTINSEWWHFDAFTREETKSRFAIVE
jgi:D-alanyl-D-alanine dipeptidase